MKNQNIRGVVFFGAVAIILVLAIQTFWVLRMWNSNERDFDRSIQIAMLNVAKCLATLNRTTLPQQNIVNRPQANYYVVNINSQINASNLDFYLRKELEAVSIKEDFIYGIYDCHDDKMVYGNYVTYAPDRDTANVNHDLPKYESLLYYFTVRFPRRTSYLIGEMSGTLLISTILLVTVGFFIYALFVITEQKRFSELQKDFINNMTHEFKTPISTIKIAADVLQLAPSIVNDARLARYTKLIREQNMRLNGQVEKVLQINKIDHNTLELNPEAINLHELLETIIPAIQVKIEEQDGILDCQTAASNPIIKADTLHLTNIIHNLLDNAMKYCSGKPEIIVETFDEGRNVVLKISDKGIGIASEHHAKVFDRFFRVPTGNLHNVKGFGLGLFYVKNIVQAHRWRIWLTSKVGEGTTIQITIPKALA
ncbi:MAG: hypothetical protein RL757_3111 [Bacteroidota bacterium]